MLQYTPELGIQFHFLMHFCFLGWWAWLRYSIWMCSVCCSRLSFVIAMQCEEAEYLNTLCLDINHLSAAQWSPLRDLWLGLRYRDRQIDTNSFTSTTPRPMMEMSQLSTVERAEMLTGTNVRCYGNNCCRWLSKVTLLASVDTPRHKKNIKTGRPQAACNKFIRTSWLVCFSDQICQHSELYDFPRWRAWTGLDSIWQF